MTCALSLSVLCLLVHSQSIHISCRRRLIGSDCSYRSVWKREEGCESTPTLVAERWLPDPLLSLCRCSAAWGYPRRRIGHAFTWPVLVLRVLDALILDLARAER